MYRYVTASIILFIGTFQILAAFSGNGTKKQEAEKKHDSPAITLARIGESKACSVKMEATRYIKCEPADTSMAWCSANYDIAAKAIVISAATNFSAEPREALIVCTGKKGSDTITVRQEGKLNVKAEFPEDISIEITRSRADSEQSGEGIGMSCDGDQGTLYHSRWNNRDKDTPLSIYYSFSTADKIDYIEYYPRNDGGTNGNFKEFDLYVATKGEPSLEYYGTYDFRGRSTSSRIYFEPALENVTEIQFMVKSAVSSGEGFFVSCAEMAFMKKAPLGVDMSGIFTDELYRALKPGVTPETICGIHDPFMRELATSLYTDTHELDARTRPYRPYPDPQRASDINKIVRYSYRDNPTGIFMKQGEDLVVFVEDTHTQDVSIFLQKYDAKIQGTFFTLHNGLNRFTAPYDGLMYVHYYTENGDEPPVNMHIASGTVNGYFDIAQHTNDDWDRLIGNASFPYFDVLGRHSALTFETEAFRKYTSDIEELVGLYDEIVYGQQEFQGMHKYGTAPSTRLYFLVMTNSSWMHASSTYTGYDIKTQSEILDPTKLMSSCWGPAHEVGHIHQTRPGLKWNGMTEVTNNILSLDIQTKWGNTSRLVTDGRYAKARKDIINTGQAFCTTPDVFVRLIPFWQLKLYMHDVLGQTDFYKDVYQAVRVQDDSLYDKSITHSYYQLEFYKIVCDIAGLDFTEFFEAWGWFVPVDTKTDDYGTFGFKLTKEQADAAKAYVAAKKYPKAPAGLYDITDENTAMFATKDK